MYDETSSIDDLLSGVPTKMKPETPEHMDAEGGDEPEGNDYEDKLPDEISSDIKQESEPGVNNDEQQETDEYGNSKEPENKEIRERLKKQAESLNRKHQAEIELLRSSLAKQGAAPEIQQAAQDFNYNPENEGDWQQQLTQMIENTVSNMSVKQQREADSARERQAHDEFQAKFHDGMGKFDDFVEVVSAQPVSDAMTLALRGVKDPAAFIYAAAKRNPQELQRIAQIRDPYSQIVEMGRLEERMRKTPTGTMAPKPVGKTSSDSISQQKAKPDTSIEDMIQSAEKRKLAKIKQFRGK